jgi:2-dehydro-3-deoxy-D-arabinonate dehydratase
LKARKKLMHLFKTTRGNILKKQDEYFVLTGSWDQLINRQNLYAHLLTLVNMATKVTKEQADDLINSHLLAPIESQEVWAAGVTYLRSRDARMEESKNSGGADFYQKVYEAERPELFFKSLPHRVAGHGQQVNIRKDSSWNVPEPELALFINSAGNIEGYTIGNDMSSRSIEGENPLYLPQAKTYERSAALGPCLYIIDKPISPDTTIGLIIKRNDTEVFSGVVKLSQMKRSLTELAGYLFRECAFETGCFLMTGTCLVPPDDFTLAIGDEVRITIEGIGTLINKVGIYLKE